MYGDTSALYKENENVIYICNHQCTGNCTSDFLRNYWNMIVCFCVCESVCFSPQLSIFLPVKYDIWIHELYFLLGNINYMLISDIIIIITDLCHLFYVNILFINYMQLHFVEIYWYFISFAVDWVVANIVAAPQGSIGSIRYVLKDGLKFFPLYGFYFRQVKKMFH